MKSNKLTYSSNISSKCTFTIYRRTKKGFCEMRILIVDLRKSNIFFCCLHSNHWLQKINCDLDWT